METAIAAVSSAAGGALGRGSAFPIDSLKVKISCGDRGLPQIIKEDGVLSLYKGVHLSVMEAASNKGITFGLVRLFRDWFISVFGGDPGLFVELFLSYIADMMTIPISTPLEFWVSRLQYSGSTGEKLTLKTYIANCKQSFYASLFLSIKPALEMAFYESLKKKFFANQTNISAGAAFLLGAVARSLSTILVYPVIRIKILNQVKQDLDEVPSIMKQYMDVVNKEGISMLYRGLTMELARGITQSSVMFMIREKVEEKIRFLIERAARRKLE